MEQAIHLMREGFIALSSGHANVPVRMNMTLEEHGGQALFMPVYSPDHARIGLKVVTLNPGNPDHGLPLIHSFVTISDAETGAPLALMDGEVITSLRTGAGSGLATKILSRPESSVLAIFGTGVQAQKQVEAVCAVRSIREILVFGRSPENTEVFIKNLNQQYDITARKAEGEEELVRADVVCTATTSRTPVFSGEYITPGTHINGIGSYRPDMAEIPSDVIAKARVIVDQREACLEEAGDLVAPIQRGDFDESHIYAELGEVLMNEKNGRTSDSEITVFKSVGNAIQDLAVANFLEKRAHEMNLGTKFAL